MGNDDTEAVNVFPNKDPVCVGLSGSESALAWLVYNSSLNDPAWACTATDNNQ